ncbi:unnamed protein product [Closterium sp. NIES-64]|nr:unnamed protein product [Closterium sp. NIES-64]
MKFAAAAAALLLVLFAAASAKRAALRSPLAQVSSSFPPLARPCLAGSVLQRRRLGGAGRRAAGDGAGGSASGSMGNYQSHVHEGHLVTIMDDVVARNEPIAEVVLAGDIFEFWYYPFHAQPPSLATILAANPNLFGPTSGFSCVLDAPGGCVTFIPCNHDMHLTAADVAQIRSPGGHYVKFAARSYNPGGDTCVLIAHGHEAAIFNAPDKSSKWAPLPPRHFSAEIIMLDRTTTTITEAKQEYALLFQKWIAENGGGAGGVQVALKVLWADIDSTYMGWFATKQALESGGRACLKKVLRSGATYSIEGDVGAKAQDVVEGATQDCSSYAVIDNSTSTLDLTLTVSTATQGRFVLLPTSIKAGTRAAVWVQDFPAPPITARVAASEAWLTYIAKKTAKARAGEYKKTWKFAFACPTSRMKLCFWRLEPRCQVGLQPVASNGAPITAIQFVVNQLKANPDR